jgi:hypothetical protein
LEPFVTHLLTYCGETVTTDSPHQCLVGCQLRVFYGLDQVAPSSVCRMCARSARLPVETMLSQRAGNRKVIKFQQVGQDQLPNAIVADI